MNVKDAKAAINLIRLGWDHSDIAAMVRQWRNRQSYQSVDALSGQGKIPDCMVVNDGPKDAAFILTYHYSLYPLVYQQAARRGGGVVGGLIGEQSASHQSTLENLARRHGFEIRFVQSGPRMIRECRAMIDTGISVVVMADLPWVTEPRPFDLAVASGNGTIYGYSTFQRLISLISRMPELQFVTRDHEGFNLRRYPNVDYTMALTRFGDLIQEDPLEFERLYEIDRFYRIERPTETAVLYEDRGVNFLFHGDTGRTWKLAPGSWQRSMPNCNGEESLPTITVNTLSRTIGMPLKTVIRLPIA